MEGLYVAVSQREIPEEEVQRFAECYVPASIVAKRFNLSSCSFARYLRQSGSPLLSVPISDEGKGDALFLRRDLAVELRIPTIVRGNRGEVNVRKIAGLLMYTRELAVRGRVWPMVALLHFYVSQQQRPK